MRFATKHLDKRTAKGRFSTNTHFGVAQMDDRLRSPASQRVACVLFFLLLSASPLLAVGRLQVVVVPVANMYSSPNENADVVSQAIYGSNVTLIASRGEWSKIQTPGDHYPGWTRSRYLRIVQSGNGYATTGRIVQVESLFANVYRETDVTRHKPIVTIPFESNLEVIADGQGSDNGWLKVHLPDKQAAWIQAGDVADPKPLSIPESIELAKRFLGLPYLWGGRSSFGFDCSGFTQMLVRVRGIDMPRDADKQAAWKGVIAVDRKDLQPGDLLFFGSAADKITHTAMYIGDGQIVQATTNGHPVVQISPLDDQPWSRLLVACRRVRGTK
jgi:hypothetical protein